MGLKELENKSIYVIREAYAEFENPAVLWSTGKDSTAVLWLCRKAFFGKIPFPVIHIDTGYKFKQMYEFRDRIAEEWGLDLVIARNEEAMNAGMGPEKGKLECCTKLKTQALMKYLDKRGFDALLLAIRRDEHGIRAKERVFSPRDEEFRWNYRDQPLEMWDQYQAQSQSETDETIHIHTRVHPILHWRELDVWEYIKQEKDVPVNPMYFAKDNKRYRCFSEDTRLLTINGLKGIDEVTEETEITTLNEAGELEYQKPTNIFRYYYDGELIHVKNRSIDLLVTPNHRLFYRRRYKNYYRNCEERLNKVRADEKKYKTALALKDAGLSHKEICSRLGVSRPTITRWCNGTVKPRYISISVEDNFKLEETKQVFEKLRHSSIELRKDCKWIGEGKEEFEIPDEFLKKKKDGSPIKYKKGKCKFDLKHWLKFLGWYLSEGSATDRRVDVCQNKGEYYDEICEDIKKLGLHPQKKSDRIIISNAPLARHLKTLHTSKEKYIPKWIKQLNRELLLILLDALMKGDGSFNKDGSYQKYTTSSWNLANDILEIGLKIGYPVNLSKNRDSWIVLFSDKRYSTPRLSKKPELVPYKGRVWDVEVDNHVVMCERNGKLCWTGNSLGCEPCTSPMDSNAETIDEIVEELRTTKIAERSGRAQDKEKTFMMQKLRALGYM